MANDEDAIFEYCRRNNVEGLTQLIRSDTNLNVNAKDMDGNTPLHEATCYNSKDCLKLLLETSAEINVKNMYGNTPLHFSSSFRNSKECLQFLLEAGADPNIKNNNGITPLELIRDKNFKKEMEEYINALSTFNIKEPSC